MKRTILSLLSFSFLAFASFAQIQGDGGLPHSKKVSVYKSMDKHVFAQPDIDALRAEDEMIDKTGSGPWRFGFNNEVNLSLTNSGSWTVLPNGGKIWNIRLKCEDALTVNLTLRNVTIPEGNELYVYNVDKSFILGKFTSNHLYEGQLGTELIPGEEAIVEYYVAPENLDKSISLEIYRVTHGYRTASEFMEKAFGSSGSCNMNVNCPDGAAWGDQKRGAVMLVSGSSGFCSGSLINNTLNDGKPYVLTANHCYSDPTSWIFRFNWESATCSNPGSSPTFQSLSGAVLRSRRTPSDFCLVEITGGLETGTGPVPTVPASYGAYFNGWNNSSTPPTSTVSIHHPSGDIKKISFDDNPAVATTAMGSETNGTWGVVWDRSTTTEGGSSGSPLFDQNHRIIGQLWGGGASCSNLSAPDYYGRVFNSWEPAGSNSTNQLKYWLDPSSTGVEAIDGYDPAGPTASLDAGASSLTGATGTYCSGDVTPSFTLINLGTDDLTEATITYGYDGVEDQTYNWTGTLTQYASEVIPFPTATLSGGSHTFSVTVVDANGVADENATNNSTSSTFTLVVGGQTVTIDLYLDCYGSETTWEITDGGGTVLYTGGGYSDDVEGLQQTEVCLAEACYNFTLNDSYGDGVAGESEGWGCISDGWYEIYQGTSLIGELPIEEAMFGTQDVREFCVGPTCSSTLESNQTVTESCNGDDSNELTINFLTGNSTGATYDIGSGATTDNVFTGLAQGDYTVTIVDGDACTSTLEVTISGPAALNGSLVSTSSASASGNDGSATISATGGTGTYTYAWTGPSSYTSSVQNPTNMAAGVYSVTIEDENGCTTVIDNVIIGTVGIAELLLENVKVYPNPADSYVTITASELTIEEVVIYDVTGKVVSESKPNNSTISINVDYLRSGVYLLKIATDKGSKMENILIQ